MRAATERFIKANDESPVVIGNANVAGGGGRYKLDDGRWFNLSLAVCRELPDGYPRWKL